ncbi:MULTISPECIES: type IV pilin biogenesis protein [Acidithiobacillus]|uniref:Type IV pilin biogenesis protein n=2 Tax=Acidithiobacillus thiooxidans TaxID=930 RepID=A0A5P9XSB8_ACITH|nr:MULTISPECIES: type IV pilin biogenesis protein [Acidithiobacillus]MBU2742487.1 type IV pilin biogenesis protein [Acidithiobacillus albertensis]MDA8176012.1 type IV pilin biogenesis protein [Acidithiobacillus sp.]QFX96293.1 type IV pilin biogenesis protein [Acidithiobacillus thiooxidans ATCC 19377]
MNKSIKKSISILLALGMNILPMQGFIPYAQAAANGINIPSGEQPQILIILDNSQGMAGVIKGVDGLSGAIMSGSGTVAEDVSSSSPVYYPVGTDGFIPPATATTAVAPGTSVQYSVPCNSSLLTTLGQTACSSFGAGTSSKAYVDNSESMFNMSENAIRYILGQPTYANNIQFGLETYSTHSISLYNTWVYYMSASDGFSFGTSPTPPKGLQTVANPCYGSVSNGSFTNYSCGDIYSYYQTYGAMKNLNTSNLYNDPYLYVKDTSDNPIINDVLYATANQWGTGATNNVGSEPNTPSNYNLDGYESKQIQGSYNQYTNGLASGSSPTSAGYIPTSQQVWNSQRGYGFDSSTSGSNGNLVVAITKSNAGNNENINNRIVPEVLSQNISYNSDPITASAGYAPVAGAFQTALNYFQGKSRQASSPPTTCGKKYVIFITFGQPTKGTGGKVYPPLGSAAASIFDVTSITASMVSATTPSNNGLQTNNNAVIEAVNAIGQLAQNDVKTYVIGVGSAVNPSISGTTKKQQAEAQQGQYVLQAMANAGGTNTLYTATSSSHLQSALNTIVANILGKSVVSSYAAPPSVTVGSLEFLLKNVNPVTGQGDLYAYPVTSNGSVSSTASWDANSNMTAATRSTVLYTTPIGNTTTNGGSALTFPAVASTDSAAFGTLPSNLTASDIAQYTINPSYDNGTYLGGRDSGWYVGLPSSAPAEVLTAPNNASLLNNAGYLSFASGHANRQNAVLFSDNDGFLYALGYQNIATSSSSTPTGPTLLWGWMPGALLPSLQNYPSFWQGNNMDNFASIDAYDNSDSKWHTYVVGVAGNGSIYYDLQLTGTSAPDLGNVVAQYNYSGYSQPVASAPVFYQVNSPGASNFGQTWALFAINNSSGSNLGILNVSSGAFQLDPLPISDTATPYIDSNGNLFLGDGSGNVYEMTAANLIKVLNKPSNYSIPSGDFTSIGNYTTNWPSGLNTNVQFIGGTFYQGKNYLRVQGPSGITMFNNSTGNWSPVWTTYSGGAGEWSGSSASSYTSNTTITPLPSGSTITDQALINNGNVIVPVTVPPSSTDTCGVNTAAYYIYSLVNGIFPSSAYVSTGGTLITLDAQGGYVIGQGNALTPSVTVFNGSLLLQGAASKNTTGGTSGFASAIGASLPLGGPTAWRLVLQH